MNTKDFVLAFNFSAMFLLFNSNLFGKDVNGNNFITVKQDNNFIKVENYFDSVLLDKSSFSIRFFNKQYNSDKNLFYAARIAVIPVSENIDIKTGKKLEDIPYFEPGSGMAADADGYHSVFISTNGHHYLYYENDSDKRVHLISRENDLYEYEWKVDNFFYADRDVRIENIGLNELYFLVLIDINLNNTVDDGELHVIKFKFK